MKLFNIRKKIILMGVVAAMAAAPALSVQAKPLLMPDGSIFDAEYYAQTNPDVVQGMGTSDAAAMLTHYLQMGKQEGRAPAAPGAIPQGIYGEAPEPAPKEEKTLGEDRKDARLLEEDEEDPGSLEEPDSIKDHSGKPDSGGAKGTNKGSASDSKRDTLRKLISDYRKKRSGSAATVEEYYADSVFVGDSIMLGFRNYAMKRGTDPMLKELTFLAAGSFGANNALKPINKNSVHPVYKGEQRFVWDSISMMGKKKMFILMGLNDLNICGLKGSLEKYQELLGKIRKESPDIDINIISMPYVLAGSEKGKLNNNSIREYNDMLKGMCRTEGYGYVDIADRLADGKGNLAPKYCSDGFLHQTPAAYDVWVEILREYADVG